ncbi:MAG: MDR family MFS transporter [Isosphaeraceae bacterium]
MGVSMTARDANAADHVASLGAEEENHQVKPANRRIVTVALMLAMSVTALEQTVVSPAMPTIIGQLKGVDIYPLVFSAYLLAATVTTPLYGKLADRLGRKRVLLFGLALFGVGSMMSGLSRSMPGLIGMRVVQGMGAGAVMPIVLTLIGDLYTLQDRAKVQGWFSAVWGVSSLAGPTIGGLLTDYLSWRWVFFVSVPAGLAAMWMVGRHVHEHTEIKARAQIDALGALWLAAGSTTLLMAVLDNPVHARLGAPALLVLSAVFISLFLWQERRAADPVLPLDLLMRPMIAASFAGSFLIGGLLFGIDTYVPLYVQGVRGGTASQAGWAITPLFLSWSISVAVAAKVVVRLGFQATALIGSVLIASGSAALAWGTFRPEWSGPLFAIGMVVIGLGMGPTSLSYILCVQHAVPWSRRGVATGAVTFFRTIGGALGVGMLGALLSLELARHLTGLRGIDVAAALRPETHARLTPEALELIRHALGLSLRAVFVTMLALAVLGLGCAARLPQGRADSHGPAQEPEDDLVAAGVEH